MKILLLNPPRFGGKTVIREERCEIVEPDSCLPPYSLLETAGILSGYDITLVDANAANLNYSQIGFAGYGAMIFRTTPESLEHDTIAARLFKQANPQGKVICMCNSLDSERVLGDRNIDFFIGRNKENAIPKIFGCNKIPSGQLVRPRYDLIKDFSPYYVKVKSGRFAVVHTSRGCPFRCTFCNTDKTVRYKRLCDLEWELRYLESRGVRLISFYDESFTLNMERVQKILGLLSKHRFKWYCNTRTDIVDEKLLQVMHNAGCRGISFGIETGSQRMQKLCNKNLNIVHATNIIKACYRIGIKTYCAFIIGLPGETRKTAEETIQFARAALPTICQFNIYCRDAFDSQYLAERSYCSLSVSTLNTLRKRAYKAVYGNVFWWINNILFVLKNPKDILPALKYISVVLKNMIQAGRIYH